MILDQQDKKSLDQVGAFLFICEAVSRNAKSLMEEPLKVGALNFIVAIAFDFYQQKQFLINGYQFIKSVNKASDQV